MSPPLPQTRKPFDCGPLIGSDHECPQAPILREIQADVHAIRAFIDGDDSEGKPGLRVRIDRLEQAAKNRLVLLVGLGLPVGVLVIDRAMDWMHRP